MASIFSEADKQKIVGEVFDNNKFVLTCKKHPWYSYGSKRPPVFNCKECQMIGFVGLMCNIPADKREEVVEMLEYSVHKLIEADKRGEINRMELQKKIKDIVAGKRITETSVTKE
jgi:hypothetical protein